MDKDSLEDGRKPSQAKLQEDEEELDDSLREFMEFQRRLSLGSNKGGDSTAVSTAPENPFSAASEPKEEEKPKENPEKIPESKSRSSSSSSKSNSSKSSKENKKTPNKVYSDSLDETSIGILEKTTENTAVHKEEKDSSSSSSDSEKEKAANEDVGKNIEDSLSEKEDLNKEEVLKSPEIEDVGEVKASLDNEKIGKEDGEKSEGSGKNKIEAEDLVKSSSHSDRSSEKGNEEAEIILEKPQKSSGTPEKEYSMLEENKKDSPDLHLAEESQVVAGKGSPNELEYDLLESSPKLKEDLIESTQGIQNPDLIQEEIEKNEEKEQSLKNQHVSRSSSSSSESDKPKKTNELASPANLIAEKKEGLEKTLEKHLEEKPNETVEKNQEAKHFEDPLSGKVKNEVLIQTLEEDPKLKPDKTVEKNQEVKHFEDPLSGKKREDNEKNKPDHDPLVIKNTEKTAGHLQSHDHSQDIRPDSLEISKEIAHYTQKERKSSSSSESSNEEKQKNSEVTKTEPLSDKGKINESKEDPLGLAGTKQEVALKDNRDQRDRKVEEKKEEKKNEIFEGTAINKKIIHEPSISEMNEKSTPVTSKEAYNQRRALDTMPPQKTSEDRHGGSSCGKCSIV